MSLLNERIKRVLRNLQKNKNDLGVSVKDH
jgi:hypothetical protein